MRSIAHSVSSSGGDLAGADQLGLGDRVQRRHLERRRGHQVTGPG